jgi:hypothetical protein
MATSGYYPPGVTGNEDIFGPKRSFVGLRACGHVRQSTRTNAIGFDEDVESEPCDFVAEVDIDEYNDALVWTCPTCGEEHEEVKE